MDIWILSRIGLQYERDELKKRGISFNEMFWKEMSAPIQHYPDVARWMLDPGHFIFQLSFMEDLERQGCRVINSPSAVLKCDKASMFLLWQRYLKDDIKMPASIITANREAMELFIEVHESVVVKPLDGQGGEGIMFVKSIDDHPMMHKWLDTGKFIMLQEFIPNKNFEIRNILVGDDEIIQYARYNEDDAHNYAQGGIALNLGYPHIDVDGPTLAGMRETTRRVASITGLDMVAVDIMPDTKGNSWLIEWNPFFTYSATIPLGLNIASKIVDFLLKQKQR
ncbi:MAG: RimK family alpha-L-glutamate ligase [Candidatus Hodarchaeota archaeon]